MKNLNLKVGDKLLCKTNLCSLLVNYFNKDKYYIVWDIKNFKDYSQNWTWTWYYIIDERDCPYSFSKMDDDLYDIFYTKSEIRKMKLEKLKNEEY